MISSLVFVGTKLCCGYFCLLVNVCTCTFLFEGMVIGVSASHKLA